jgi:hypothetical protein
MAIMVATDEQTFAASNGRLLQWRVSLAGETELRCSPSTECDRRVEHRYDWTLGISHVDDDAPWGDWMTEAEMVAVQILVRTPNEILCTEDHPQLLGLHPSRETLPNEGTGEHWYMYRFLDTTTRLPAIEWNILPKTLEEGGPFLRGSITLAFHGCLAAVQTQPKVEVMLRAGIRFRGSSWLQYSRPCSDLGQRLFPEVLKDCRNAAELERKMKLLPQLVVESQLIRSGTPEAEPAPQRQRRREPVLSK